MRFAAAIFLSLLLPRRGRRAASILVLANGDRLTGEVVKREDGKITFHSDVLGDIVVPDATA